MFSIVAISFLIISAFAQNSEHYDNLYGKPEQPCSKTGGMCIKSSECEEQLKAASGLCPSQKSEGFECCHGQPKSETRCQKLGGECFDKSACKNTNLRVEKANDCKNDEICCVLI